MLEGRAHAAMLRPLIALLGLLKHIQQVREVRHHVAHRQQSDPARRQEDRERHPAQRANQTGHALGVADRVEARLRQPRLRNKQAGCIRLQHGIARVDRRNYQAAQGHEPFTPDADSSARGREDLEPGSNRQPPLNQIAEARKVLGVVEHQDGSQRRKVRGHDVDRILQRSEFNLEFLRDARRHLGDIA